MFCKGAVSFFARCRMFHFYFLRKIPVCQAVFFPFICAAGVKSGLMSGFHAADGRVSVNTTKENMILKADTKIKRHCINAAPLSVLNV